MQSINRVLVITALLVSGAAIAPSKNGRDFAGFYKLSNRAPDGNLVRVTLTMQLFNYSGADLPRAAVTIRSVPPETMTWGTYSPIEQWHDGSFVKFAMHLSIQRAELERWLSGAQPVVFIVTQDASGRTTERTAQLSQRPAIELQDNPAVQ